MQRFSPKDYIITYTIPREIRETLLHGHSWHPLNDFCTPIQLWQGHRQFLCKIHLFRSVHELFPGQGLGALALVLSEVFRRRLWSDYHFWLSIRLAFQFLYSVEETISRTPVLR